MGSPDACLYAEIRTRIPDTVSWDYHFEHDGNTPVTFTVKVLSMHPVFLLALGSMYQLFILVHQEYMICYLKFQSAVLKETIDDLEWPGSSIQIRMQPDPPTVILKGEGHGDLQVCYRLACYVHLSSSCAYNSLSLTQFGRLSSPIMQIPTF